jgi:hypothetical protein
MNSRRLQMHLAALIVKDIGTIFSQAGLKGENGNMIKVA